MTSDDDAFDALMSEVLAAGDRFGHRQHVHLTWLAVRRFGTSHAMSLVGEGIQRTARYAGAPQKYHETMSRAWVELVGHHVEHDVEIRDEHDVEIRDEYDAEARDEADAEARDEADADRRAFEAFAERNPALLDKRLLSRFYRSSTLAGEAARTGWVEPDLAPFPWLALT
jgi:hypothetical protein